MSNFNRVTIGGRLVADPEKTEAGGHTKVTFTVASNRIGKQKDVADFIDVVAWRQTGDYVAAYQRRGSRVLVDGRLEQQRWEDKEGNKRSRVVVVANQVVGYDYSEDNDGGSREKVGATASEDIPF